MRIQVLADGIELTDGIRAHAHKRLYYAIGWAGAQVELVQLRVLDLNGPKGGVDKCCRIRIELRRGGVVTIEEIQSDMYVAVSRAVDRAGRTLARQLERLREHRRERFSGEPVEV